MNFKIGAKILCETHGIGVVEGIEGDYYEVSWDVDCDHMVRYHYLVADRRFRNIDSEGI